jgi:hypothetical protein
MAVGGQLAREFIDQRLHGRHGRLGQDERDTGIALRTDGTEDPGCVMAHIAEPTGADAAIIPDAPGAADLTDAGLILVPELYGTAVRAITLDPLQLGRESFLKRSRAFGSALGWLGRVF